MNKNFRVITINGIRGLFAAIFVILGLIAGFIISPGWVCMKTWNYFFTDSSVVASMNIYQGIMLWSIIALSLYALNNKKSLINFGSYQGLSPEQIRDIMERAKNSEMKILKNIELKQQELIKNNIQSEKENISFENQSDFLNKEESKEEVRR